MAREPELQLQTVGGDIGTIFGSLWFLGTSDNQETEVHCSRPCEASNSLKKKSSYLEGYFYVL